MATRPARLLTGYGGWLDIGTSGLLLVGSGYPEVDVPDAGDTGGGQPRFSYERRPLDDELSDDDLLALVAALLLTA